MEKYKNRIRSKSCRRLLIFIIVFIFNLFSFYAANPYVNMKFIPSDNQLFITEEELEFRLVVPSASPRNVFIKTPDMPDGLTCTSVSKSELIDLNHKRSTLIEMTFLASKKGVYQLDPTAITVNRRNYTVFFDYFEVKANPYLLIPAMEIKISDSDGKVANRIHFDNEDFSRKNIQLERNKPYKFSIYVNNISSLDFFTWDIPLNSIFSIQNDWEESAVSINKKAAKFPKSLYIVDENAADKISFEQWGQTSNESENLIPNPEVVELLDSDYGKKYLLAEFEWTILTSKDNVFPKIQVGCHSFSNSKAVLETKYVSLKITEKTKNKSDKHEVEKNTLYDDSFTEENLENENIHKFSYDECLEKVELEKSNLSFFKKLFGKKYGIILETDLFSIPEETASRVIHIESGVKVEIVEQTDSWIYVISAEGENKSGWCKKDKILLIK